MSEYAMLHVVDAIIKMQVWKRTLKALMHIQIKNVSCCHCVTLQNVIHNCKIIKISIVQNANE